ncbi:uncharacterized protein EV420DRAFT_1484949 [Desarmillaria tabescens]|uniref:Uncharacterized protein n=1 Tax=Armillaria tabescens TaxID=1929756 RepID=A0AA39JIJ7_ARMTA|nr:uncharacterized protein EV420DRAFT_1484949 [Desarmillaria tabescens]KAK0443422.1 hypothetical protein EV420DRAFT_1484949 [Desarmillaria tabescens]
MRTRSTLTVWDIAWTSRVWRYRCMGNSGIYLASPSTSLGDQHARGLSDVQPSECASINLYAALSLTSRLCPDLHVYDTPPLRWRRERQYASIHTFVPWEEHDSGKAPIAVLFPGQLMAA